jgi:TonB-linked outer membrane protein, SusC/RagA family
MRKLVFIMLMTALTAVQALAQTRTITGTVTDEKGNPVSGATVQVKGSKKGTSTSADGTFSMEVPSNAKAIEITSVGMTSQELPLGGNSFYSVKMTAGEKALQEVVVVGYGTQRRKEVTGNLASVKGSAVAEKPVQSFEQALGGRAAGVRITIPSGVLNSPPVFNIRGVNSLSLSSYPLIVIDGVPTFTGDVSSVYSAGNALASINPNDIESIDIAKDAAATSIYGSRAANGVVFVTTKKGKNGKPRVSYDVNLGWSNATRLPKMLNAFQYTDFKNMAYANNPAQNQALHFSLTNDANGNPINTDWYNYVYQQGFSQTHTLSVSGGNESTTYYLSAGYSDQKGIFKTNTFTHSNILFNVDSKVNDVITVGGKISFSNEKNGQATTTGSLSGAAFNTGGLARLALVNSPNVSPYNNDGTYNININNVVGSMNNTIPQVGFYNPVPILNLSYSNNENNHIQSNMYVQLKPTSWMTLKSLYGIDYLLSDNALFQNPLHGDGQGNNGLAISNLVKYKEWIWDNTAQFDYTYKDNHNVSLLLGNEQNRNTSLGYGINRQNLSDPGYNVLQAGFTINNNSNSVYGENYLLSNFGRLNYDYKKKYFLSANIRRDEYSAFAIKGSTFWGASAGWELSKENFWSSLHLDNVISNFKLRGSYGKVGNIAGIGDYATYSLFSSGIYGGTSSLGFSQAGNIHLNWENSYKTDFGFTFGLLKDRISGELAYYNNNISDLILNVPQSLSTGIPNTIPTNAGQMYNRGIELTLSAVPVRNKDFTWNTSFNLTTDKNMVTALSPGLTEILTSTSISETVNRTAVGYSAGYLWVIRTGGVDPATGRRIFINSQGNKVLYQYYAPAGQFNYSNPDGTKYVSPTGGSSINQSADAVMYANVIPKEFGGWDNNFHYKGFDIDVLLTYQAGFYVYYGTNAGLHDQRFWNNKVDVLDAWKKPGDIASIPKPVYGDNISNGSGLPLDINVFRGDFVKVKNVSIGYSIPKNVLARIKINSARLYVSGQNLAIITKYPGPDPEVSSNGNSSQGLGVDRNTGPNARTITVGLNIGF